MLLNLFFIFSYLIGAIPNGYIISKSIYHFDIQKHESGNIGATNVLVTLGILPSILTFILDALVGFLPAFLTKELTNSLYIAALSGVVAVFGHDFSIYMKGFKGGRGVATSFGVGLAIVPKATFLSLFVFVVTVVLTRYVAVGSILAILLNPIFVYLLYKDIYLSFAPVVIGIIIIISHRKNIINLITGNEIRAEIKLIKRRN